MSPKRRRVGVRRIYEEPTERDGTRVLVDRVWPRGMSKERARIDLWCKQVAPSTELRKWYRHDPERFEEFRRRYLTELEDEERAEALDKLRRLARSGTLTLLTSVKEVELSHVEVLVSLL